MEELVAGTLEDVRRFLRGEKNLSAARDTEIEGHVVGLDPEFFHAFRRHGDDTGLASDLAGEHTRAPNLWTP